MYNELKMLIMGHRTFTCPLTNKCLDVRKSVAFEVSIIDPVLGDWSKIYGPFDKSAEVEGVSIEQFIENKAAKFKANLRVITG